MLHNFPKGEIMRFLIRFVLPVSAVVIAIALVAFTNSHSYAQDAVPGALTTAAQQQPIALPAPRMTGGMPLMQALSKRKTTRTFSDKALSMQQLSNLLWASFGVNRKTMEEPMGPHSQGRTAPSGGNSQDIDLYVATASGAYLYDAVKNQLKPVASGDVRAKITSAAAAKAAVTIVFVAPTACPSHMSQASCDSSTHVGAGFIGQNAYLYAASEGLNAWFYSLHGSPARSAISTALNLDSDHAPIGYEESVGYPEQ